MDSKIRCDVDALGLLAESLNKHKPYDWQDTRASLIVISLLSLGLWGTVASLAAALG